MKKSSIILMSLFAVFVSTSAFAINLDKIAGAVQGATSSGSAGGKNPLDEVFGRVEERINKYEKKIDSYEQKLDQAEKAIDRVTAEINNFDKSQIEKYVKMVKFAVVGLVLVFVAMLLLVVAIFIQTMRINGELKKLRSVK